MNFDEKNDKIWKNILVKFLDFQSIQNQFLRTIKFLRKIKGKKKCFFNLEDFIFVIMFLLYRPNFFTNQ